MNRTKGSLKGSAWLAAGCFALLFYLLIVPPSLGIADNGDYARVMVFFNLTHAPADWGDRYFGYLNTSYVFDREAARRYASPDFACSALLLTGLAVGINALIPGSGFNLLVLGTLHCLVFALAVFWIAAATRGFRGAFRTGALVLGIVVATDIAYSAYLNSFYSEAASLLFFVFVLASGFQASTAKTRPLLWVGVYAAAVAGFLLAKYQNLALLPFLLVFPWRTLTGRARGATSQLFLIVSLVLCYSGYRFWLSSPAVVGEAVLYNSVFNGILRESPSPQKDLEEMGLNPEWAQYAGSTAFDPASLRFKPEFAEQFLKKVNIGTIFRFYLARPLRLWRAVQRGIRLSFTMRPPESGNYTKSAGRAPGTKSYSWAMWSSLRTAALPRSLWFLGLIIAAYLVTLAREWRKDNDPARRLPIELGAMIPFMALQQLLLLSITDGVSDLVKHGFLSNLLVDMMLVVLIAYGWSLWVDRHAKTDQQSAHPSLETAK
jgi:hypothetical protein